MEVSLDRKAGSRDEVEHSFESYDPLRDPQMRPTPYQAFVRIMIGCDKFCTYCIVPRCAGRSRAGRPRTSWPKPASWPPRAAARSRSWARPSTAISTRDGGRTTRLSDLLAGCTRSTGSTGSSSSPIIPRT